MSDKKFTISDIEEIKFQADNIAGLTNVFALFLDFTKENEFLRGGMECLVHEAKRLQTDFDDLLEKLFPSKNSVVDNTSD